MDREGLRKMELETSKIIKRYKSNPILSEKDIPYQSALVFNAGVSKYNGKYVMLFRNDYGDSNTETLEGTNLGLAFSDDGLAWEVEPEPVWQMSDREVRRVYDPRITVIDGRAFICFAQDTEHGIRGGIAVTEDFHKFDIISLSVPDNRNMVLFPEKINGYYYRLERPFPVYGRYRSKGFDVWISCSGDLEFWGRSRLLLGVEDVPFANDKIGPAAPPIKTEKGWLTTFHAVDIDESRGKNGWEDKWQKRYTMGLMLLDLNDPYRVIGLSRLPLMVPEADYEVKNGFRTNVIFPGGMILEDSGEVKIYYGASDTVECLAVADVNDLINFCLENK